MEREQQLLNLGFDKNKDQQSFIYSVDALGGHIYVDFHLISKYNNDEWTTKIESIIKTIRDNDGVLYN